MANFRVIHICIEQKYTLSRQPHSFQVYMIKEGRGVVAPIPLKLVRAFSEESHSVNTIRQVFFVIAIWGRCGWKRERRNDLQVQITTTYRDVR